MQLNSVQDGIQMDFVVNFSRDQRETFFIFIKGHENKLGQT